MLLRDRAKFIRCVTIQALFLFISSLQCQDSSPSGSNLRIAFLKQDTYGDLYIGNKNSSVIELFLSTIMRVGPLSLFDRYHADFYIVSESNEFPCQIYREILPYTASYKDLVRFHRVADIPFLSFLDTTHNNHLKHSDFAVDADTILFDKYDIVIALNACVPTRIIKKYPHVLWCYMIGENNMYLDSVHFGYDVALNQNLTGVVTLETNVVTSFPYSFIDSYCLENIVKKLRPQLEKKCAIYMEINNTSERPVKRVAPEFELFQRAGIPVLVHEQNIVENIARVYEAKYFVKLAGRKIQGNSLVEAISLGSLIIMARDKTVYPFLILDECNLDDGKRILDFIYELEKDPSKYDVLIKRQRELLDTFVIEHPIKSLVNAYYRKINKPRYALEGTDVLL